MEKINDDFGVTQPSHSPDRDTPDMFNLVPAGPEVADLFYSCASKPQGQACIGYLRGYYADGGKRLYTSWFEHRSELKTHEFQEEFDKFINGLREKGILNTRPELEGFCFRQPEARIVGARYKDTYGFRAESEKHSYYLRLSLMPGDYAIYCFCYNCSMLLELERHEHPRKKTAPER